MSETAENMAEAMAAAAVLGAALARFENALDKIRRPERGVKPMAAEANRG